MRGLPRSLRARSALVAAAVAAALFTVGAAWLLHVLYGQAYAATEQLARQQSDQMASLLVQGASFAGDFGALPYEVTDQHGTVLAASAALMPFSGGGPTLGVMGPASGEGVDQVEPVRLPTHLPGALAGLESEVVFAVVRSNQLADPFDPRANQLQRIAVLVTVDNARQAVQAVLPVMFAGLPVFAALAALAAAGATRSSLRAVVQLRDRAEAIAADPTGRPDLPRPRGAAEIEALATTLNRALRRQDEARQRERRFVADAAHELRNPLASVIVNLDMASTLPGQDQKTAAVEAAARAGHRLQKVTEDLLLLSSVAASPSPRERVDLTALIEDESRRDGVPVTVTGPAVAVTGHPNQLRRAIANLLDNAQRHASSAVQVTVRAVQDSAVVEVSDDGAGIDPADWDRIFLPFVRLDESRSRDDGGTGLGLAIVHDIAAAHDGSVAVVDGPNHSGTTIRVILRPAHPGNRDPPSANPDLQPADHDAKGRIRRPAAQELKAM